jgi:uncharacterized Rossmann fold enzyme
MNKVSDFWNIHKGEKIVVCGCGVSILDHVNEISEHITIGINDIERALIPNYILISDTKSKFSKYRSQFITESQAEYVFTHKHWPINPESRMVMYRLGSMSTLQYIDDYNALDYSNNSPYIGCLLAYKMGARYIGLIGVDFTKNHFYAQDGEHPLAADKRLNKVCDDYKILKNKLSKRNVELYNLSDQSEVDTIPKISFKKFKES